MLRSKGGAWTPSTGCRVWCFRVMQYNFTFDLFRELDLSFLRVSQLCSSGIGVTFVLKASPVLKVCLSQAWSCCLMTFTTRFSPCQSLPARSPRAASIGSCRGGSWGSSWPPLASSGVSSTQEMLCKSGGSLELLCDSYCWVELF